MTFRTEFPDFDPATLPAIPAAWTDISWHNDACPSFDTAVGLLVYVNYDDNGDREIPDGSRFMVMLDPEVRDGSDVLFESDDWQEVLTFVTEYPAVYRQVTGETDADR